MYAREGGLTPPPSHLTPHALPGTDNTYLTALRTQPSPQVKSKQRSINRDYDLMSGSFYGTAKTLTSVAQIDKSEVEIMGVGWTVSGLGRALPYPFMYSTPRPNVMYSPPRTSPTRDTSLPLSTHAPPHTRYVGQPQARVVHAAPRALA